MQWAVRSCIRSTRAVYKKPTIPVNLLRIQLCSHGSYSCSPTHSIDRGHAGQLQSEPARVRPLCGLPGFARCSAANITGCTPQRADISAWSSCVLHSPMYGQQRDARRTIRASVYFPCSCFAIVASGEGVFGLESNIVVLYEKLKQTH